MTVKEDKPKKAKLIQTRVFACVIEAKDKDGVFDFPQFRISNDCAKLALMYTCDYWYILHDKDINEDTGELKHWHYHLILRFPTRHTPIAVVKLLADYLCLPSERISVDKASSLEGCLKYLTHDTAKNFNAHVYSVADVHTNCLQDYNLAMSNSLEKPTTDFIIDCIKNSKDIESLIKILGADNYCKYRWLIHDYKKGGFN
jgi:hypothetical protein